MRTTTTRRYDTHTPITISAASLMPIFVELGWPGLEGDDPADHVLGFCSMTGTQRFAAFAGLTCDRDERTITFKPSTLSLLGELFAVISDDEEMLSSDARLGGCPSLWTFFDLTSEGQLDDDGCNPSTLIDVLDAWCQANNVA